MACVAFMLALMGMGGTAIESSLSWEAKANPGYLSRWFFSEERKHSQETCRVGSLGAKTQPGYLSHISGERKHTQDACRVSFSRARMQNSTSYSATEPVNDQMRKEPGKET